MPAKRLYYADGSFEFLPLPDMLTGFREIIEQFNVVLEGDPEKIIYTLPDKEESKE